MRFRIAYCMHRGAPPRQQDALLVGTEVKQFRNLHPKECECDDEVLIALADGVATSPHAQFTSRFILDELLRVLERHPQWCRDDLATGRHVREVHAGLCAQVSQHPFLHGSSSTLVAAHLKGSRVAVINTGDSRAYLRKADGSIQQLSHDHTEWQRLRDAGEADDATGYASVYGALSDCLIADSLESEFAIHRATAMLAPADLIVLCTDGVHDVLGDNRWLALLVESADPTTLVKATRIAVLQSGAPDNFSVIALKLE